MDDSLTYEMSMSLRKCMYQQRILSDFVETNCHVDGTSVKSIVCRELYDAFENYCKIRKIKPLHDNSFGAHLIPGIKKDR